MNFKNLIISGSIVILSALLLAGCGGGGSDGAAANNGVISGVASKGIIDGGIVTAYAVNEDGSRGAELDSVQTSVNGEYSLDVGDYNGPVIIEVTGGSYTDEASGEIVANDTLRAIIPQVDNSKKVAVTPLTELAVQIAGVTYDAAQINNANAKVAVLMGGADIIETQPQDIDGDLTNATDEERNYTILLAVISQMIENGVAADVADAVAKLKADFDDDGQLGSLVADTLIQEGREKYSGFQENNTNLIGAYIKKGLKDFLASPENHTGLTPDDITLDENIDAAVVEFILTMEEHEYDGDNILDERITYTYDANGNTSVYTQDGVWDDDYLINGNVNYNIDYTYDTDDRVTREDRDHTGDGTVNYRKDFTYDAAGNLVLVEIDSNFDGTYTYIIDYTYDANGNKTLETYDTNGDGTIEKTFSYIYDANNNMTQEDTLYSGVLTIRRTLTYNAAGNRSGYDSDGKYNGPAPDGIADFSMTYEYNADGKLAVSEADFGADGTTDAFSYFTYNADGNLVTTEYDSGLLGVIDERIECTYDSYKNRTLCETGSPVDGVIDQSTKYTWTQQ